MKVAGCKMNKQKLDLFVKDIENLHNKLDNIDIKNYLCTEFKNIKEKHLVKKEESKNVYEEVEKMLYKSLGEASVLVPINIGEIKSDCNDNVRVERLELVDKKLKSMGGESLLISALKGYLLFKHKNAIGVKDFNKFLDDTEENYDYCNFLIKLHRLVNKYKNLQRCKLPVRFFKTKFVIIKQICCNNPKDWE